MNTPGITATPLAEADVEQFVRAKFGIEPPPRIVGGHVVKLTAPPPDDWALEPIEPARFEWVSK